MPAREIKWLLDELPGLVESGVLTPVDAERMRAHYLALPEKRRMPVAIVLLAVLGALCTGLGIILILANNWEQLSRPVRAVIAFMPLVAAQALAVYTLLRRPGSQAMREGIGAFLVVSVAAAIALIGQTYNVPGSLSGFCFTWLWLVLPVGYLLQAVVPTGLYIAIVVGWAIASQMDGQRGVYFYPLMLLAVPHLAMEWRRDRYSARSVLLGWLLCAGLAAGTGVSLVRSLPGLWVIIYASLFATMYLAGLQWQSGWQGIWRRPFHTFGAAATGILALLLSFRWPWREIGWHYYRTWYYPHEFHVLEDYILAIALPLVAAALLLRLALRGRPGAFLYGSSFIVAAAGYALASEAGAELPLTLYNLYVLVLGVGTLAVGIRSGRLAVVNGGMFMIAALIVLRFFDSDIDFIVRGVAFIVLGLCFIGTNIALWRRGQRNHGEAA
ncbi:MAG: DUF2157 domain-containing protein [FCB group bacterium]|jgi:uncharacterized membrane protein|nr:DUF2157 domain-containing protein [FCB group bacterium]